MLRPLLWPCGNLLVEIMLEFNYLRKASSYDKFGFNNLGQISESRVTIVKSKLPPRLDSTDDPSGIQQNVSPADAAEVAGPDSIPLFIRALCFHPKKRETDVAGQGAIQTKFSVPTKDDYNNPANYAGWCANFSMCLKKKVRFRRNGFGMGKF